MRRVLASPFVRGFLGALAGSCVLGVLLVVYHLWTDHVALHAMLDYLNAHAAAINHLPTTP